MHAKAPTNIAARAARWSVRHRRIAIVGWLASVVVALAVGHAVGERDLTLSDKLDGESGAAMATLDAHGFTQPASESILVQSPTLTAADPQFRAAVTDVTTAVGRIDVVRDVRSPYAANGHGLVSADGHSVLVQLDITGNVLDAKQKVGPVLDTVAAVQREHPSMRIDEYGSASLGKVLSDTTKKDFQNAEKLSLPITLVILVVAFGALVAAGVPLVFAVSAVAGALGLLGVTSHVIPVDPSAGSVLLLIGLAVGVDYSLFYVRREREERAAGRSADAALHAAAATSGHSVLISGLTVLVAMGGMFFTGDATFSGIASATMLVVALAVVGSLTVLPAVLSKLGDRIEKGRVPFLSRRRSAERGGGVWAKIVGGAMRRPAVAVLLAGGALIAMAVPALSLHTDLNNNGDVPQTLAISQTYNRIQAAFPGGPAPAMIVVENADVTGTPLVTAIAQLHERALASGQMHEPIQVQVSPDHHVALVSVPLSGTGQDSASNSALDMLRRTIIPATVGAVPGTHVNVSGQTAATKDFNDLLGQRAPIVFAFVLGLAFVILLAAFRSLVIAAKAIVLNLLSVAASYGVLVALFQWGWGERVFGFHSTHSVVAWLPLFLFVILFGLSMDYHVFIISRIREAHDRGMSTEHAIAHGIRSTASVVTAAAGVMVAVFAIFATLSAVSMKEVGVGLAAAVLIDATLVRVVLLPASMRLLGELNWYQPRWLSRTRCLEVEAPDAEPAAIAA
jgi:RND superfamily putative drug exporter